MGVNIVQKRNGEKLVDLTGATLSSSDGGKILTGETAFGRDGNKITGTMLDYTQFKTYLIDSDNPNVTLSANTRDFPLPAIDLGGRPIRLIQIYANFSALSTTSTSMQNTYITGLTYSSDYLLKINSNAKFVATSARVGKSNSTTATATAAVFGTSYFSLVNENLIAQGGAIIRIDSSKIASMYFKGGATYYVMVGG